MGFFKFLARNLVAAVVGAVGIMLLALGYADQARDIWSGAQPWQLQAGGAFLFVISVIMVLYGFEKEHSARRVGHPPPASAPTPKSIVSEPVLRSPSEAAAPAKRGDREYLNDEITPQYLKNLFQERTEIQAQRLIEQHLGRWMIITAPVAGAMTTLGLRHITLNLFPLWAGVCFFSGDAPALDGLNVGDVVTVEGKLDNVSSVSVRLMECEIVSVKPKTS